MEPGAHEFSDIHLPERWAVLEQALQQIEDEDESGEDVSKAGASKADENVQRNRDAEDTRSRNQPVRPAAGNPASGEQHSRGGMR